MSYFTSGDNDRGYYSASLQHQNQPYDRALENYRNTYEPDELSSAFAFPANIKSHHNFRQRPTNTLTSHVPQREWRESRNDYPYHNRHNKRYENLLATWSDTKNDLTSTDWTETRDDVPNSRSWESFRGNKAKKERRNSATRRFNSVSPTPVAASESSSLTTRETDRWRSQFSSPTFSNAYGSPPKQQKQKIGRRKRLDPSRHLLLSDFDNNDRLASRGRTPYKNRSNIGDGGYYDEAKSKAASLPVALQESDRLSQFAPTHFSSPTKSNFATYHHHRAAKANGVRQRRSLSPTSVSGGRASRNQHHRMYNSPNRSFGKSRPGAAGHGRSSNHSNVRSATSKIKYPSWNFLPGGVNRHSLSNKDRRPQSDIPKVIIGPAAGSTGAGAGSVSSSHDRERRGRRRTGDARGSDYDNESGSFYSDAGSDDNNNNDNKLCGGGELCGDAVDDMPFVIGAGCCVGVGYLLLSL